MLKSNSLFATPALEQRGGTAGDPVRRDLNAPGHARAVEPLCREAKPKRDTPEAGVLAIKSRRPEGVPVAGE